MVKRCDSPHPKVVMKLTGNSQMFVRAVWRVRRLVDIKQTLRELDVPSTRQADNLGISSADFPKMTRSLFDR
jgi:hypothetical protein